MADMVGEDALGRGDGRGCDSKCRWKFLTVMVPITMQRPSGRALLVTSSPLALKRILTTFCTGSGSVLFTVVTLFTRTNLPLVRPLLACALGPLFFKN